MPPSPLLFFQAVETQAIALHSQGPEWGIPMRDGTHVKDDSLSISHSPIGDTTWTSHHSNSRIDFLACSWNSRFRCGAELRKCIELLHRLPRKGGRRSVGQVAPAKLLRPRYSSRVAASKLRLLLITITRNRPYCRNCRIAFGLAWSFSLSRPFPPSPFGERRSAGPQHWWPLQPDPQRASTGIQPNFHQWPSSKLKVMAGYRQENGPQ
ncbi:hypothetical protein NDU88_002328 [Pleurodeles waltl]|uniref:Uncharacterized protein n=1 Tax=Pleurodeles waltl TaxID=8319 RepID=A0AAV7MQ72_PLEWA|nr:hypothetical protein NDU88_002328 [Pleurodeles waltl]